VPGDVYDAARPLVGWERDTFPISYPINAFCVSNLGVSVPATF